MRLAIFFYVLLIFTEIIKNFRIWSAWVTNWSSFNATTTTPPVFMVIIKENMLTFFDTTFVTIFARSNFGNFSINSSLLKNSLPNQCGFSIFWNAIFFVTDKASHKNLLWIKTNFFSKKIKESRDLFIFEIITK